MVGNWIYEALGRFQAHIESSMLTALCASLAVFVLSPLSTLVHEAGHALAARWLGVPIREVVVHGDGPGLVLTRSGVRFRLGLGLARDLRSKAPFGWVMMDLSGAGAREAIVILTAGSVAQALFGAVLLGAAFIAPIAVDFQVLLAGVGLCGMSGAVLNLVLDGGGRSDGARIRRIRSEARRAAGA